MRLQKMASKGNSSLAQQLGQNAASRRPIWLGLQLIICVSKKRAERTDPSQTPLERICKLEGIAAPMIAKKTFRLVGDRDPQQIRLWPHSLPFEDHIAAHDSHLFCEILAIFLECCLIREFGTDSRGRQ